MERFLCLSFLTAGLVSSAPTKPPSTRSTRNMNQFYGNPYVDSNSIQDQYQGPLFQQMIYKGLTPQDLYSNRQNYGQQFPHQYQNTFLPHPPKMSYQIIRHEHGDGKGIFDFVGDWIQQTGWFPIEVNIPDAFSNLGQGFQQFGNNVGGWFQGIGSNLPFFGGNNNAPTTSLPAQPPGGRPSNRYYVLVPAATAAGGNLRNSLRNAPIKRVSVTPEGFFNPFGAFFDNSGNFPPYP